MTRRMWAMSSQLSALSMVLSQCQSAAATEPGEGALDHPAAGENLEALDGVGTLDDLHGPTPDLLQRALQLRHGIAAVGEDMAQPRIAGPDGPQQCGRAITVLDVGAMHGEADQ